MNENVAHRYILNYMSVKKMRNVGILIINMTSKWEKENNGTQNILQVMEEQNEDIFRLEAILQWYGNSSVVVEV
jgi:hypothetical protein